MNCEPGDLAMIVSTLGMPSEAARAALGMLGRVMIYRTPNNINCPFEKVWQFEEPLRVTVRGKSIVITGCADEALRPISKPGDQTKDEMLRPLPQKETA